MCEELMLCFADISISFDYADEFKPLRHGLRRTHSSRDTEGHLTKDFPRSDQELDSFSLIRAIRVIRGSMSDETADYTDGTDKRDSFLRNFALTLDGVTPTFERASVPPWFIPLRGFIA
jgi:hypothetical protein